MQWNNVHQALRERYEETGDERVLRVARRVNRLIKKRIRRVKNTGKALRSPSLLETTPHYKMLMDALQSGKRIVAIDNEWTFRRPITEIGVAEYNGQCDNIRLTPGGKDFLYGTTRYMTEDQAKKWLSARLDGVGLIIGHVFRNDVRQYERWNYALPNIPILDTGIWSRLLFPPNILSLASLAEKYEINTAGWHCAGNDAQITLNAALAMAKNDSQDV